MKARTHLSGRATMLALAALAAMALVALPSAAFAKTATRILVASRTVDNSVDGTSVWPVQLPAALAKKVGAKWVPVSGTLQLARYDDETGAYVSIATKTGKSISFSVSRRGKYRVKYLGAGSLAASTAYATLRENIGLAITAPQDGDFTVTPSGTAGMSWVTATYTVRWNSLASDVPFITVGYEGLFSDFNGDQWAWGDGVWTFQQRDLAAPGVMRFDYLIQDDQKLPFLHTWGNAFLDANIWDPYVIPATEQDFIRAF